MLSADISSDISLKKKATFKRILVGVSGSISAYKTADFCRLLKKTGYEVKVVLTHSAAQFVSPLTLKTLTDNQVYQEDSLEDTSQRALLHIELARWADFIIIYPISANTLAKLAYGLCDNLLTSLCLATQSLIAICPAMNKVMWHNIVTQKNRTLLEKRGFLVWGPESGEQACGEVGGGRLIRAEEVLENLQEISLSLEKNSQKNSFWSQRKVLISAGPTVEPIDIARVITNRSSGKMGYALAQAAHQLGAHVTLVSGPVNLEVPSDKIILKKVTTTQEMFLAVKESSLSVDIFISVAAVADWRVESISQEKIKSKQPFSLKFIPHRDILKTLSQMPQKPFLVGFCAESHNLISHAYEKLKEKNLDMIIANDISHEDIGFDSEENAVSILTLKTRRDLEKEKKETLAFKILDEIQLHFLLSKENQKREL